MPDSDQPLQSRAKKARRQPPLPGLAEVWEPASSLLNLRVTFDQINGFAEFCWTSPVSTEVAAVGRVRCTGADQLTWEVERNGRRDATVSSHRRNSVRSAMERWLKQFPTRRDTFTAFWIRTQPGANKPVRVPEPPFGPNETPYRWIEDTIVSMAEALRLQFSPLGQMLKEVPAEALENFESYGRRLMRREQKREEEMARRRENMERLAEERRHLEQRKAEARQALEAKKAAEARAMLKSSPPNSPSPRPRELPPLPVRFEMPALALQETAFPLADLRGFFLGERAALWWVSNQSDDLLCLPHCRIERLEYQIRTALRVLGPLRGRALLSDEVGLGKTIEAGTRDQGVAHARHGQTISRAHRAFAGGSVGGGVGR
jgi:hypothetical protein